MMILIWLLTLSWTGDRRKQEVRTNFVELFLKEGFEYLINKQTFLKGK